MSQRRHLTLYLDARESNALAHRPEGTTEHGWIVSLVREALRESTCEPWLVERTGPTERKLSISLPEAVAMGFNGKLAAGVSLADGIRYLLFQEGGSAGREAPGASRPAQAERRHGASRDAATANHPSPLAATGQGSRQWHRPRKAGALPVTEAFGPAFDTRLFRLAMGMSPRRDDPKGVVFSNLDDDALVRLGSLLDGMKVGDTVDIWIDLGPNTSMRSEHDQNALWRSVVEEAWAASTAQRGFHLDGRHYRMLGELAFRVTAMGT